MHCRVTPKFVFNLEPATAHYYHRCHQSREAGLYNYACVTHHSIDWSKWNLSSSESERVGIGREDGLLRRTTVAGATEESDPITQSYIGATLGGRYIPFETGAVDFH